MKSVRIVITFCLCLVFSSVWAEQVRVQIGGEYAEATLISHRNACVLVSVQHVFPQPGREVTFTRDDDPIIYRARVDRIPSETQLVDFAGWARVTSAVPLRCVRSLEDANFDAWTGELAEMYHQAQSPQPFRDNFHIRLRSRDGLVHVPIKLVAKASSDQFIFSLDPRASQVVADRAGISGSGVYLQTKSPTGGTEYRLVGKVDGPAASGRYRALRIELIAGALGLVGRGTGNAQSRSGAGAGRDGESGQIRRGSGIVNPTIHTQCDILAANPGDPDRFPGIDGVHGKVLMMKSKANLRAILDVCRRAAAEYHTSPRLAYQVARILHFAHKVHPEDFGFADMMDALNKAQSMGHEYTQVNIDEVLLATDRMCPDYDTCALQHRLSVDLIRVDHPDRARLGDFKRLVSSDLARNACPDWARCKAEGVAAMVAVTDPDYVPEAKFNLAWMYVSQNYTEHCGGPDECKPVVADWLQEAVEAGTQYAAYWQGIFLSRQNGLSRVCRTRLDCQKAAIAALDAAGQAGDGRGFSQIGYLVEQPGWKEAIGCGSDSDCDKFAYMQYQKGANLGADNAKSNAAWILMSRQDEIECGVADVCFEKARDYLDAVVDKTQHSYLRQYANLLRLGSGAMADVCEADACDILAARSYLEAHEAGDTSMNSAFHIAQFAVKDAAAFGGGTPPADTATECDSAETCISAAMEWYETAARGEAGAYLFDEWYDAIRGAADGVYGPSLAAAQLSPSLSSWLTQSANFDPSDNFAFSKFANDVALETGGIPRVCAALEGACEARASSLIELALETDDPDFLQTMSGWIGPGRFRNPSGPNADNIRRLLLRAVPVLDRYNVYDIFRNGLYREIACPIGQIDCPETAKRLVSEIIAQEGATFVPQLHAVIAGVGWTWAPLGVAFNGWHMSTHEDVLRTAQFLASHDVPLGNYFLAVHANEGGGGDIGWTETGAELYRRVASVIVRALERLPTHEACGGAVILATMNDRKGFRVLSSQSVTDAYVLALAYCGKSDLFYEARYLLERDRNLAARVQANLRDVLKNQPVQGKPFAIDGDFGNQSWAAVSTMHGLAVAALPNDRREKRISMDGGFETSQQIDTALLNAAHTRLVNQLGAD